MFLSDGISIVFMVRFLTSSKTKAGRKSSLSKTNLKHWQIGSVINVERSLKMGDRLDGHLVQGHVDTTGKCVFVEEKNGSWNYTFEHPENPNFLTVEKGSICVNGVSLTVVNSNDNSIKVN